MHAGGHFVLQIAAKPLQIATLLKCYYWQPIGTYQRLCNGTIADPLSTTHRLAIVHNVTDGRWTDDTSYHKRDARPLIG